MALSAARHPTPDTSSGVSAAISLLGRLTAQAEATLCFLSSFVADHSPSYCHGDTLAGEHPFHDPTPCFCPYDRRHRMPPEFLFCHSLRCAAATGRPLPDLGFLEELRYPRSLKSAAELREENSFVRPLPHSGADLCFSLEKELEDIEGSSFSYRECPGVVRFPEPDVSSRTFMLPACLAVECANFVCGKWGLRENLPVRDKITFILPSAFWAFRREMEAWKDYPHDYSYTAARVASSIREVGNYCLQKWIISNSPQFGVVVDAAMGDHIFLLLTLCLKAIGREASGSLELPSRGAGPLNPCSLCYKCPRFFQALSWLASQLSILYGENNGKNFAISMIAETFRRVGASLLWCPSRKYGNIVGVNEINEETHESKCDDDVTNGSSLLVISEGIECRFCSGNASTDQIFVSQVAAAVAALHERLLLEEKVKLLRFPQLLSRHQLLTEHASVSAMANDVRAKRSNYKPILENDGFLWQKPHSLDISKTKTREELLAEERDYKRRRMSYRGKKVKRTPTQVIRDIIDEHMELLKQTSEVECAMVGSHVSKMPVSESNFQGNANLDDGVVKEKVSGTSVVSSRNFSPSKETHCSQFDVLASVPENAYRKDSHTVDHYLTKDMRRVNHKMYVSSERSFVREVHMDHEHGVFKNYSSDRQSNDSYTHQRKNFIKEASWSRHEKRDSVASYSFKVDGSSLSLSTMAKGKYSYVASRREQREDRKHRSRRSGSSSEFMFEDRYDPNEEASNDVSPREYNL